MRKFTVRDLTLAALVAALYAVMGYFGNLFGLTFGAVQLSPCCPSCIRPPRRGW